MAIKLNPNYVNALIGKGNSYFALNEFEESIRCFDFVIDLDPLNVIAFYNKGNCLNKMNRMKQSVVLIKLSN